MLQIVQSVMLLIMSSLMLYMTTTGTPDKVWQSQAIERGYATHCPSTGSFAWKGGCN